MNATIKNLKLVSAICLAIATAPAMAAANSDQLDQQVSQLTQQTQALQKQLIALQNELNAMKKQKAKPKASMKARAKSQTPASSYRSKQLNSDKSTMAAGSYVTYQSAQKNPPVQNQQNLNQSFNQFLYLKGMPVVTSPYAGVHSAFDASDLIVNVPSVNEDTRLLQMQNHLTNELRNDSVEQPDHPFVELSGKLEGIASYEKPYQTSRKNTDIDLASAEIDTLIRFNPWVLGFIGLDYDNGTVADSPSRIDNSRVFLNKGFITVGNLDVTPIYGTLGQIYVPFGHFASNMISSPITMLIGRTKARALVLGFTPPCDVGPYGSVFGFRGDTAPRSDYTRVGNFGADLGYKVSNNSYSSDVSVSYLQNLADSQGMQETGAPYSFTGFGESSSAELLSHRVGAGDIQGTLNVGSWGFMGEYVSVLSPFSRSDMTFNTHGAAPQAVNMEGSYSFKIKEFPASVALGFGGSRQALALNVPEKRYIAALNISFWQDTIQTLEFRHDENYSQSDYASGAGSTTFTPVGAINNALTAQFGVYF